MANSETKIHDLTACTAPSTNDELLMVGNLGSNGVPTSYRVKLSIFFSNTVANTAANLSYANAFIFSTINTTPANNIDIPVGFSNGTLWSDGNYLYIISNNTISRTEFTSF